MKAMILAAGRGERMMPLTANTPKPLLDIGGKPLLQHHIENLKKSGFNQLVINHCYLGEQIEARFAKGEAFDVEIKYSPETVALETAGGIRKALSLLEDEVFLVVNGDVWTDYPFELLLQSPHIKALKAGESKAHLVLVENPPQNPKGDFGLIGQKVVNQSTTMMTFSGIALYHASLVDKCVIDEPCPLAPLLREATDNKQVTGELYQGEWIDVGTPERLNQLNEQLNKRLESSE